MTDENSFFVFAHGHDVKEPEIAIKTHSEYWPNQIWAPCWSSEVQRLIQAEAKPTKAPDRNTHLTGGLRARKVRDERYQHQNRYQQRHQHARPTTTEEEHPLFSLPSELQNRIFRNHYFDASTHNPVICIHSNFAATNGHRTFTTTPVDEAILTSSNQGAAIWLNGFAAWFDRHHRIVADAGALYPPVGVHITDRSAVAAAFLRYAQIQVVKSLPPGRHWQRLYPKLESRVLTRVRELELLVEPLAFQIPGVVAHRRGVVALTRLVSLGIVPHLERLHLKFARAYTFLTTATAVKGAAALDARLDGLKVVLFVNDRVQEDLNDLLNADSPEAIAEKKVADSYGHAELDYFMRVWTTVFDRPVAPPEPDLELVDGLVEACSSGLRELMLDLAS